MSIVVDVVTRKPLRDRAKHENIVDMCLRRREAMNSNIVGRQGHMGHLVYEVEAG